MRRPASLRYTPGILACGKLQYIYTYTITRFVVLRLIFLGLTYKTVPGTILQSFVNGIWYLVDVLSSVRERAVFKPNTRRRAAGKAAASTHQPNLQSELWCKLTALLASSSNIYLFVNVRQSADLFWSVLPTNTQNSIRKHQNGQEQRS